jgi:hypothetical protein
MPSLSEELLHGKCISFSQLLIYPNSLCIKSSPDFAFLLYISCILAYTVSFMQLRHNGFVYKVSSVFWVRIPAVGPGPANPSGGNLPIPSMPPWWAKNRYMHFLFIVQMFPNVSDWFPSRGPNLSVSQGQVAGRCRHSCDTCLQEVQNIRRYINRNFWN